MLKYININELVGEKITIFTNSFKIIETIYFKQGNSYKHFKIDPKSLKFPIKEIRDLRLTSFIIFKKNYYYVIRHKYNDYIFKIGRTLYNKICESSSDVIDLTIHRVNNGIYSVYDKSYISISDMDNISYDIQKYINCISKFENSIMNWDESIELKEFMDRYKPLNNYVLKKRKSIRKEKIKKILGHKQA